MHAYIYEFNAIDAHFKQRARVAVPDIDLRVFTPADDEGVVRAAERRSNDEAALLLPQVPA